MRLTSRDGMATGLAAAAVAAYIAFLHGVDVAPLSDARAVTAGVFVLGMAACWP
ncbi:hypothetical protein SAMN05421812_112236 [Asanoa hainanensis]|uniref:Uncharacterized protein n=1 Tax=Asanoa hainanensis TaxID=560556 RepID=A0A239P2D7_9ACTN|nr:hypothetical protein [Asanoa hainanensis]SNT60893.1 hypothetical protein SAMN05421812_112236 [Asanoa hainanensis]